MTSKAKQLEKIGRGLGEVKIILKAQGDFEIPMRWLVPMLRDVMVPGWTGTRKTPLTGGLWSHEVEVTGLFSADGERHTGLWEWLEKFPTVSCLVVYTALPDHSFNFGPREL